MSFAIFTWTHIEDDILNVGFDVEKVVVETPSPSVAQAVVDLLDKTYHVTPEVWAFARRGQVHRLLGDLGGMNVTKLLIPEEACNPDGAWQGVVRQPDGTLAPACFERITVCMFGKRFIFYFLM
jgi:hypothetical protein